MTTLFKYNWGVLVVILLSFWAVKPLFIPGFFPMHDDTQVARVFEMGKALKDGMFPVRWVQDLGYGYGYPIFNFYAPLAYYVGGSFTLLGFDALIATKIMMGIGILLAGIFMYLLAREFWGEIGGVLSGLFYVYAPYHALDIYVRGDVAEFWGYAFIPLMFLGFYKVFDSPRRSPSARLAGASAERVTSEVGRRDAPDGASRSHSSEVDSVWKWVVIGSLGYAGVILSHNLTAMMVTPFLIIVTLFYCYIVYKRGRLFSIFHFPFSIFLGLALSAFYWLPALLEMKYTNVLSQIGGGADFRDHFVCIGQLWESNWGFGGSIPGCIDGLSFRIGKLHILAVFVGLLAVITYRFRHSGKGGTVWHLPHLESLPLPRPNPLPKGEGGGVRGQARMTGLILLSILGFAISTYLTLELSKPIWEAVPLMAFFQYPWRFLLLASFFSSLLSGGVIWFAKFHLEGVEVVASPGARRYLASPPSRWVSSLPRHLRGVTNRWAAGLGFAILIFLLIYFNSKLFQPQIIVPKTASDYTNEYALKWTASKISDEFLPPNFKKPKSEREIARSPATPPQETLVQKTANLISLAGIAVVAIGIIIIIKKRLSV